MIRNAVCSLVVALCACQRGTDGEVDSAPASSPAALNITVIRTPLLFTCGDREASLWYHGDSVIAVIDGRRWQLVESADSAGRYAPISDSGPVLWRRNDVTRINLNGLELPHCVPQSKRPFVARGHEPGWVLRIVDSTMTYIGNYGSDTVTAPVAAVSTSGEVTTYTTASTFRLTATVRDETCADGATGMPHPYTVSVTHDTTTVHGCGGEPSSLLVSETWTVAELGGVATTDTRPTLTFMAAGRVGGTTSCNRYSAPYRLAGEGLSFGAAISTKMACPQPVMDQEVRFLRLLARIARFEIAADGALRLLADDGQAIIARRQ
jgi:heat shock protein HslJ